MPYVHVEDFRGGMNRQRMSAFAVPGTAYLISNGHLNRGGEIEKRYTFLSTYSLPADTHGLQAAGDSLYVFGHQPDPGMPAGVTYQRLAHPSGEGMSRIIATDVFDGLIYAIAEYADDSIHHFYDGVRIGDWDGGAGNPASKGTTVKTLKSNVYSGSDSILNRSAIDDPTDWTDGGTGVTKINAATHMAGLESIQALGIYDDLLAIIGRNATQIWQMDPNPDLNLLLHTLPNFGTRSPRSVQEVGNNDTFLLCDNGIRSLQPRDSSSAPNIEDIGTPIDPYVKAHLDSLTATEIERAASIIDPNDGRYMLAVGDTVFVFTYFRRAKIAGWSIYEPGFTIDWFTLLSNRVYARSNDTVYLYGGTDGRTYDATTTFRVTSNFLAAGKVAHIKEITGIDVGCEGTFSIHMLVDPRNHSRKVHVGTITDSTYLGGTVPTVGSTPLFALDFVHEAAGAAKLANFVVHYEGAYPKTDFPAG